jgi:hypothetical protein
MSMRISTSLLFAAAIVCARLASSQPSTSDPHIGYLYPAGGQQGTTLHILVGGQSLRGAGEAYVSGEGVHATVFHVYRPIRNINADQRQAIRKALLDAWDKRVSELPEGSAVPWIPGRQQAGRFAGKAGKKAGGKADGKAADEAATAPKTRKGKASTA